MDVTHEMIHNEAVSRVAPAMSLEHLSDDKLALAMLLMLSLQIKDTFTALSEALEMMDAAARRPDTAESLVDPVTDPDHYA